TPGACRAFFCVAPRQENCRGPRPAASGPSPVCSGGRPHSALRATFSRSQGKGKALFPRRCAPPLRTGRCRPGPCENRGMAAQEFRMSSIASRHDPSRNIRAPRGTALNCRSWLTEAPYRMLQNNLDAEVAEDPASLVVYGGIGRAARDWDCYDRILETLRTLGDDETLLVQSGKPVGVFRTHADAPRVLIANSNLVPHWANWEHFHELDRKGLMMYGQMTAGSWIYIGSQGIVQGTFETFVEMGR